MRLRRKDDPGCERSGNGRRSSLDRRGRGPMRMCLMIEGQENVTWDQWVAIADAAERAGFDALFRSDHYLSLSGRDRDDGGTLDAWTTLAALSGRTSRIHLGTLVTPVTFRHPSVLAKSVVTVDHASGGRVELGMGAAWHEGEHRAYGFAFPPPADRFSMLEEQVEIVHRLWSRDEETVTFSGHFYQLDECRSLPKPVQRPHPRLLLGGHAGPRAVRLAARWADEYNTNHQTPDELRAMRGRLDRACEEAGRDPATLPLSQMAGLAVGATQDEARTRAAALVERRGR